MNIHCSDCKGCKHNGKHSCETAKKCVAVIPVEVKVIEYKSLNKEHALEGKAFTKFLNRITSELPEDWKKSIDNTTTVGYIQLQYDFVQLIGKKLCMRSQVGFSLCIPEDFKSFNVRFGKHLASRLANYPDEKRDNLIYVKSNAEKYERINDIDLEVMSRIAYSGRNLNVIDEHFIHGSDRIYYLPITIMEMIHHLYKEFGKFFLENKINFDASVKKTSKKSSVKKTPVKKTPAKKSAPKKTATVKAKKPSVKAVKPTVKKTSKKTSTKK